MAFDRWKYQRDLRHHLKLKAFAVLGGVCRCGFSDWRALQLDHIHGGGTKERLGLKKFDLALVYYRFIIKNPEDAKKKFQLLCANCNWIKRYEANELGREVTDKTEQLADPLDSVGGDPGRGSGETLPLNLLA